jgi:hypothetical protein
VLFVVKLGLLEWADMMPPIVKEIDHDIFERRLSLIFSEG